MKLERGTTYPSPDSVRLRGRQSPAEQLGTRRKPAIATCIQLRHEREAVRSLRQKGIRRDVVPLVVIPSTRLPPKRRDAWSRVRVRLSLGLAIGPFPHGGPRTARSVGGRSGRSP